MDEPKPLPKDALEELMPRMAAGELSVAEQGMVLDGFRYGTLGVAEAVRMVEYAGGLTNPGGNPFSEPSSRVVKYIEWIAAESKAPEIVGALVRASRVCNANTRRQFEWLLSRIETPAASAAMCEMLEVSPEVAAEANTWGFVSIPRDVDVFFPRLLPLLGDDRSAEKVMELLLAFAKYGMLKRRHLQAGAGADAAGAFERMLGRLSLLCRKSAKPPGLRWCYVGKYSWERHRLTMLVDAVGLLPKKHAKPLLRSVLDVPDPRVVCFAALGLRGLGCAVPASVWRRLAGTARERALLFERLPARDFASLVPARLRTAKAVSEGLLVDWLTFGTELGFEPAAIEPLAPVKVKVKEKRRVVTYYLFKFRPTPKADWLVGLGGAFAEGLRPVARSNVAVTFSNFEKLGKRSVRKHLAGYLEGDA